MNTPTYIHAYFCAFAHTHIYTHVHVHIYTHSTHMHKYTYMHIYMHTHMHIPTHTHIIAICYTNTLVKEFLKLVTPNYEAAYTAFKKFGSTVDNVCVEMRIY